ncbi:hypothetical protein N7G274_005274 [Stereocaulon virgatum]|uniref:Uncharacterized protein n=1 Tax=Stereocaulon virgatum TaxID=373712 RepID=A0ABR4A9J0_9LECA
MALGWNNFDSIVFLEQFNNGYPMTIKDMVANFDVVNEHKKGDGADKLATITCHDTAPLPAGRAGVIGGDNPKWCNKPEFAINRPLIHLPKIGDTADRVYNRIIPATNGDCKLVTYPGSQYFESYKVTLTGLPSAIACGLNNLVNLDGTEVPVNGDQPGGTDGSQSTDGQGGAIVKAQPPALFKPLAQTDYAYIFHGSDQPFCLPPAVAGAYRRIGKLCKTTGDPTKKSDQLETYKTGWYGINANRDGQSRFNISAPNDGPDPVCCLFTEPSFRGDVWCVGVGGGDILPQWKDKPQSISCHAGGQVWLYADDYNDEGEVLIRGNVEDLKDEPYGPDKRFFSKNVRALWVLSGN